MLYGTVEAPEVPLDQISIPTGLFVGTYDVLSTVEDNVELATKLNPDQLVWHETYPLGHMSFAIAKDMDYFTGDVMSLVGKYATNTTEQYEQEIAFLANK